MVSLGRRPLWDVVTLALNPDEGREGEGSSKKVLRNPSCAEPTSCHFEWRPSLSLPRVRASRSSSCLVSSAPACPRRVAFWLLWLVVVVVVVVVVVLLLLLSSLAFLASACVASGGGRGGEGSGAWERLGGRLATLRGAWAQANKCVCVCVCIHICIYIYIYITYISHIYIYIHTLIICDRTCSTGVKLIVWFQQVAPRGDSLRGDWGDWLSSPSFLLWLSWRPYPLSRNPLVSCCRVPCIPYFADRQERTTCTNY